KLWAPASSIGLRWRCCLWRGGRSEGTTSAEAAPAAEATPAADVPAESAPAEASESAEAPADGRSDEPAQEQGAHVHAAAAVPVVAVTAVADPCRPAGVPLVHVGGGQVTGPGGLRPGPVHQLDGLAGAGVLQLVGLLQHPRGVVQPGARLGADGAAVGGDVVVHAADEGVRATDPGAQLGLRPPVGLGLFPMRLESVVEGILGA